MGGHGVPALAAVEMVLIQGRPGLAEAMSL
jgi:hypothetical protein